MRKRIISTILCIFFLLCIYPKEADAKSEVNPYGEPQLMRVTCYCDKGYTYSGSYVIEGIVAARTEWLGYNVIIYDIDMNCVGIFEVKDTGFGEDLDGDGIGTIQEGESIDVYRDTLSRCYEWVDTYGDYMYIQIFRAEG